jgi:hypothetical protein
MRKLTATLCVGCLLAGGCNPLMHRNGGTVAENAPTGEQIPTGAKELVGYLNECSGRLNSLRSDLDLDCKAKGQSVGLGGALVCEKPRNLRLRGTLTGQSVCDIGSNNEEFWYWIKQEDQPLYHCSYEAMARGNVPLPFPFQPDMVMAALGMADFNPDPTRYQVKVLTNTVELSESVTSPSGRPVQKVTVFARGRVDEVAMKKGRPQVVGYKIRDERGVDVCTAIVDRVTVERGAVVPQKIRLNWPAEKMDLALTLRSVKVNSVDQQLAATAFSRAGLPYRSFDLARGTPDPSSGGIMRTRGSMR